MLVKRSEPRRIDQILQASTYANISKTLAHKHRMCVIEKKFDDLKIKVCSYTQNAITTTPFQFQNEAFI